MSHRENAQRTTRVASSSRGRTPPRGIRRVRARAGDAAATSQRAASEAHAERLARLGGAAVLVDANFRPLYVFGQTDDYLERLPQGPRDKLPFLLRRGVQTKLRTALREAAAGQKCVTIEGRVKRNQKYYPVRMVVTPSAKAPVGEGPLLLVAFEERRDPPPTTSRAPPDAASEREALRRQTQTLATINRVSMTVASELELEKVLQSVTDAGTEITGAEFGAFFYNALGEDGQSYSLVTVSGVPRETFEEFPMPRSTELFAPTLRGEGVVRVDDVRKDPRYGRNPPHYGIPKGHLPVRSYLAVPVVSRTGEVHGALFFGHREVGVFTPEHEQLATGIAAEAAVAIDNARLYEAVCRERDRVQRYLDMTGSLVVALDRNGKVLLANRKTCEVLGYEESAIVGKDWFGHFLPNHCRGEVRRAFERILRGGAGGVAFYESPVLTAAGQERIIQWHNTEVRNHGQAAPVVSVLGSGVDITEGRRAEKALRESEERYRTLVETSPDAITLVDTHGTILTCNQRGLAMRGCQDPREVIGKSLFEFIDPSDHRRLRTRFRKAIRTGASFAADCTWIAKSGARIPVESNVSILRDEANRPQSMICITRDVTARKQMEAALGESEKRLRAIVTAAADAIITIDENGIIQSFNPAAERMFGYKAAEVVGRNVRLLMPSPYAEEHDQYISRYLQTGEARVIGIGRELTARRHDGSIFPVDLAVSEVDHLRLFTGIVRDISERKRLQEEVLRAAEDEQRRIGQELHDDAQQQLAGLAMLAKSIADTLPTNQFSGLTGRELTGLRERAAYLARGLNEVNRHVHLLARGLIPSEIEAHGLHAALVQLSREIRELYSIDCRFEADASIEVRDNFIATHLYRIAQEALTNAAKHAHAREVIIRLRCVDGGIRLEVEDDGLGIPEDAASGRGRGLQIMNYRSNLIGAVFRIGPAGARGATISCTLLATNRQTGDR